jgi:hypothetical protein
MKNRPIKMAFSAKEAARFVGAVREERASVEEVVERVNVSKAQATVEADLVRIRAQIDDSVGTDEFHATLQQKLMAALSLTVLNAPSKSKREGGRNRTIQATAKGRIRRGRVQPRPLLVRSAREEGDQNEQHKQIQTESNVQVTCSGVGIGGTGSATASDAGAPHKATVTGERLELCVS